MTEQEERKQTEQEPSENSFAIETISPVKRKTTVTFKYQVSGSAIDSEVTASRPKYVADDDVDYIFDNQDAMQSIWQILGEGINLLRQKHDYQCKKIVIKLEFDFLYWFSYGCWLTIPSNIDTLEGKCECCQAPWKIVEKTRPKPWREIPRKQTATYKCGCDGEIEVVFR